MSSLYLHHHLGMGDHIICNGLVRRLLSTWGRVEVFAKEVNAPRVSRMFSDCHRIGVIVIPHFETGEEYIHYVNAFFKTIQYPNKFMRIGHDNVYRSRKNFDEVFYEDAGIPFEERWSSFHFARNMESENRVQEKLNPDGQPYMFVHDDPIRGFEFTPKNPKNLKVIKNDPTINMFDMASFLEHAEEIHCMESSFRCFVEGLPNVKCPLYFHRSIRIGPNTNLPAVSIAKKPWIVV